MSTTTKERGASKGFVAESLRRPIQEAVRDGVREALREQDAGGRRRSGDEDEGGGAGRWLFGLLALVGIGVAVYLASRRMGGDGGGRGRGGGRGSGTASRTRRHGERSTDTHTERGNETGDAEEGESEPATPGAESEGS